ncbi:hypothetical protein PVAND_012154 [Polypedilum vanderplanki]|uniref:WD repeat-containing protein 79 n=1 Tax=Polypedilum vanderplanki TaxID=319348 RepID=A0A9J6CMJ2_POLVA|nr:hypothetical protein PVAND_012154 [Polypedilum vanderplanki]
MEENSEKIEESIAMEEDITEENETKPDSSEENKEMKDEQELAEIQNEKEKNWFKNKQVIELGKIDYKNTSNQHYFQGNLFSPDGTCILTAVNAKGILVFELPHDLYNKNEISTERDINILKPVINIKTVGNVYDFCWYPHLNSMDPETCFFLASCQNEPLKCYDAFNGSYKCAYRAYDYADELEAALSCCFSGDGSLIFTGLRKGIAIFNTSVPGRDYDMINLKKPVSCIAANYYYNEIAAGSWNKTITLIDSRDYLVTDELNGHKQGVTFLKYSTNGEYLISGSRKDSNLLMWDMRNRSLPLYKFSRRVDTNQRVQFDISYNSNWLVSGDTNGIVHVWGLNDLDENAFPKENQYQLHEDACTGVSLHNYLPILATSSGQFKFDNNIDDDDGQISTEPEKIENSLVLWWISETT